MIAEVATRLDVSLLFLLLTLHGLAMMFSTIGVRIHITNAKREILKAIEEKKGL